MSRSRSLMLAPRSGFPRPRGDEPAARKAIGVPYVFSPPARG